MNPLPRTEISMFSNERTEKVNSYRAMIINSRETEIFLGTSNGQIRVFDIPQKMFKSKTTRSENIDKPISSGLI